MVWAPVMPSEHTNDEGLRAKRLTRYDRLGTGRRSGASLPSATCVRTSLLVSAVICQQLVKVPFLEQHHMIEAFASDRCNQPFHMTVLPSKR